VHATLDGLGFPESLRWRGGALWFSDMFRGRVVRWMPGGPAETVIDVAHGGPGMPGGLGWLPDGDLLVVDCLGRRVLRVTGSGASASVSVHADLAQTWTHPANDLHVDPDGTAWVGGYGFDPESEDPRPSRLVRIDPDGTVATTAADLVFPNGCARRDDGALVVAETFAHRVSVLSPDAARVDARMALPDGSGPDGLTLDGDAVTVALAFAGSVVRLTEDGSEELSRAEPGMGCYDVAVEADLGLLAIATASLDEPLAERVDTGRVAIVPYARRGASIPGRQPRRS
jgi:sugar lactone lactonase YvrE